MEIIMKKIFLILILAPILSYADSSFWEFEYTSRPKDFGNNDFDQFNLNYKVVTDGHSFNATYINSEVLERIDGQLVDNRDGELAIDYKLSLNSFYNGSVYGGLQINFDEGDFEDTILLGYAKHDPAGLGFDFNVGFGDDGTSMLSLKLRQALGNYGSGLLLGISGSREEGKRISIGYSKAFQ